MVSTRHDNWLHSPIGPLLESWKAIVDFQLIIDSGKVTRHVTKIVTKAESSITKGGTTVVSSMTRIIIREGLGVQTAIKRIMSELLGE